MTHHTGKNFHFSNEAIHPTSKTRDLYLDFMEDLSCCHAFFFRKPRTKTRSYNAHGLHLAMTRRRKLSATLLQSRPSRAKPTTSWANYSFFFLSFASLWQKVYGWCKLEVICSPLIAMHALIAEPWNHNAHRKEQTSRAHQLLPLERRSYIITFHIFKITRAPSWR